MTAKNRIIKFLEHLEIGQSAFEKKVGISNGYINNLKGSFGSKIIGKVSSAYPELNTLWLLTGEGEMLKTDTPKVEPLQSSEMVAMPREVLDLLLSQQKTIDGQVQAINSQLQAINGQIEVMGGQAKVLNSQQQTITDLTEKGGCAGNAKVAVG